MRIAKCCCDEEKKTKEKRRRNMRNKSTRNSVVNRLHVSEMEIKKKRDWVCQEYAMLHRRKENGRNNKKKNQKFFFVYSCERECRRNFNGGKVHKFS